MLFEFVNSISFTKINRENFVNFKIKSYICNDEFENVNPMDIVSRIKFFLNYRNIASSQFADCCEIPRPTVSQLLNGRNKKVSDEVISKIHSAYPDLSIMWLMFGEEPMFVSGEKSDLHSTSAQLAENPKIDVDSDARREDANLPRQDDKQRILFTEAEAPIDYAEIGSSDGHSTPITRAIEDLARSVEYNRVSSSSMDERNGDKHIVSVMVLYSDNSFVSFVPEKR